MEKETIYKIVAAITACIMAIAAAILLPSCNVTRVITTEAKTFQKGDSTVQIVTKTSEIYDASKKSNL